MKAVMKAVSPLWTFSSPLLPSPPSLCFCCLSPWWVDQFYLHCFIPLHVVKSHRGRLGTGNTVIVIKLGFIHDAAAGCVIWGWNRHPACSDISAWYHCVFNRLCILHVWKERSQCHSEACAFVTESCAHVSLCVGWRTAVSGFFSPEQVTARILNHCRGQNQLDSHMTLFFISYHIVIILFFSF